MADVQRQNGLGEHFTQLLLQAEVPIHHQLHFLVRVRAEAAPRCLLTRPLQRFLSRTETAEDLLIDRTMQMAVFAPFERVHQHQRGTAAVLALVPSFAFLLVTVALAASFPAMPLAVAAALGPGLARLASFLQFLVGSGGNRLAVALDDEHLAIAFRQRPAAEPGIGEPAESENPL